MRSLPNRTCRYVRDDGSPCRSAPLRGEDYCFWHSPDHTEQADGARRLGGLRRRKERTVATAYEFQGLGTVTDIRRLLEVAASPIGTRTGPRSSPATVAGPPAKTTHHQTEGR